MDVSWAVVLATTVVMAAGAVLQGAIGFGLGLVAVPFLIYVDLRFVPGPLLVAALTLHLLVSYRERSAVDTSGLAFLLSGRLLGTIPAAALLAWLPMDATKLLLAGVVLAGVGMTGITADARPTRTALFSAGTASGFMATVGALGGPPVALVYQHSPGPRLRGTLAVYFIAGPIVSLAALAAVGRFSSEELRLSFLLIPGTVLGYVMSHPLALYLDAGYTRTAVLAASALAALSVVATVIF
jgi:uncharacterized membrane protein YfcA